MKKILLLAIVFMAGCATVSIEDQVYRKVIELPNMGQAQIYQKSLQWMAKSFVSAKAVTEYTNAAEGKIIGNFTKNKVIVLGIGTIRSKLEIDIKPGRARMSITPVGIRWGNSVGESYEFTQSVINDLHGYYSEVYGQYSSYMKGATKKDVW